MSWTSLIITRRCYSEQVGHHAWIFMHLLTCFVNPEPLVSRAPYRRGSPDPDADGDSVMDVGGNDAEEWAPSPLVSQSGSDIDDILNNKSENIGGDNEHMSEEEDFFWQRRRLRSGRTFPSQGLEMTSNPSVMVVSKEQTRRTRVVRERSSTGSDTASRSGTPSVQLSSGGSRLSSPVGSEKMAHIGHKKKPLAKRKMEDITASILPQQKRLKHDLQEDVWKDLVSFFSFLSFLSLFDHI